MSTWKSGLKRGQITEIAKEIGISRQAVAKWPRVPGEHVLTVERVTGKTRYILRPDIYLREELPAQAD